MVYARKNNRRNRPVAMRPVRRMHDFNHDRLAGPSAGARRQANYLWNGAKKIRWLAGID
jgi:hypothetical protein